MADAKKFYAIRQGYVTGVFDTWPKAQKHIKGYKGAEFKSFPTKLLAEQWLNGTTKRRVLDNLVNKTSDVIKTPDVTKNSDVIKPTSIGIKCQFDDTDEPVKSKMPMDKRITVYVDGSCQNHPIFGAEKRVAGIGVWWGEDDPKNVSEVFEIPPITNQRAELAAILRAIKMFLNDHRSDDKYLLIESDSMYSIKCCTEYRHGWSRKGWRKSDGQQVLNLDLIKQLDNLLNQHPGRIYFHHVESHVGIEGNENADRLAVGSLDKYKTTG